MLSTLTPAQRRRIDQIVSVFENDTIAIQYGYTELLDDGRGDRPARHGWAIAV